MPRRLVLLMFLLVAPGWAQPSFEDVTMTGTEERTDDLPALALAPDGSLWSAFLSYSDRYDEIGIRQYSEGTWSNLQWVPNTSGDVWFPQIAVDGAGKVWAVWAQGLDGNWDLFARSYDPATDGWGSLVRLSDHPLPDINLRLAARGNGDFAVVWQGFRGKHSNVFVRTYTSGTWQPTLAVTERPANDWEPAAAWASDGTLWVVYDSYKNGNYDVYLRGVRNDRLLPEIAVAETPRYEVMPTVAVDAADRVWIAWEQGAPNWGKDTGYTIRRKQPGAVIGNERDVAIRVYDGSRLLDPPQALNPVFDAAAGNPKWSYQPHVFTDAAGHVAVVAKLRRNAKANPSRGYWAYYATTWTGAGWSAATEAPHSWGRSTTRIEGTRDADGDLWLTWPTDNRPDQYAHRPMRHQVYAGRLELGGASTSVDLRPAQDAAIEVKSGSHPNEPADLDTIRGYRTRVHGRPVQIVRGDFHRHTELSWDGGGGNDGSLKDFYRYMIDAAAMDFGASTDHQGGANDYWWWYSQKMTDMYHVPGAYTAVYGYERSATQPNGHRNVFFSDRSGRVTPFFLKDGVRGFELGKNPTGDQPPVGTSGLAENDTKLLYEAVRAMDGVIISHTSGTRMGTDWRDNDPALEPVVEIFQGARSNYEQLGAPLVVKEGTDDNHMKRAGYVPAGMVNNAWAKGYRLGIITSSDHGSTHYSYAMVYTDRPTRDGILDAIRRRHTYGATDNILLDVRMGQHFMGDEFRAPADGAGPISIRVRGTVDVASVEIIRDSEVIYTQTPNEQTVTMEYADNEAPGDGTSYYYVRVQQVDGNIAWSSPIWVNY